MSDQQPLMIRLLSASVAVANRAGAVIRDVLKSGQLGIVHKVNVVHAAQRVYCRNVADVFRALVKTGACDCVFLQGYDDPQTEADRRAERCIVATLTTRFPHVTIIGEEVSQSGYTLYGLCMLKTWGRTCNAYWCIFRRSYGC